MLIPPLRNLCSLSFLLLSRYQRLASSPFPSHKCCELSFEDFSPPPPPRLLCIATIYTEQMKVPVIINLNYDSSFTKNYN